MTIQARMNSDSSAKGRRGEVRHMVDLIVQGTGRKGEPANVLIQNISASGLLLETDVPLAIDEEISIKLPVAGDVTAKVVWESGNLFGCQFHEEISSAVLSATQLQSPPRQGGIAADDPDLVASDEPFNTRLARLRYQAGISVVDMARMLGVNRVTVWNWERGKARPLPARLSALADVLGVSKAVLLSGEEPPSEVSEAQAPINGISSVESSILEQEELRFDRSVRQSARLSQLIAASKDQIAAISGTTPDKIRIILEF